jgi:hypothetical protein
VRTEEGKLHLFVAVNRTSKYAFAQLHKAANVKTAAGFLAALVEAVPYRIHTVLTTTASSSATRLSIAQARPPATACMASTGSAASTTSGIGLPSRSTRGPMARSSG